MSDAIRSEEGVQQARLLRGLAERLEHGADLLPADLEESLARELEDRIDREAVRAARQEQGRIPLEELKAKLGL